MNLNLDKDKQSIKLTYIMMFVWAALGVLHAISKNWLAAMLCLAIIFGQLEKLSWIKIANIRGQMAQDGYDFMDYIRKTVSEGKVKLESDGAA